jgi:hypothetical protein
MGQAQEDRPCRQLFESHLAEIKPFIELHIRLRLQAGTKPLLQRIVNPLEFPYADWLAKNRGHL